VADRDERVVVAGSAAAGAPVRGFVVRGGTGALVWIGLRGHLESLRALLLTLVAALAGSAWHLYAQHASPGNERYLPFAIVFVAVALVATVGLGLAARWRRPAVDTRGVPAVLRWGFVAFSLILVAVGASMVFGTRAIFPAPLGADTAVVYGWFFLGSFVYYGYAFVRPALDNAVAQMISFLVYDLLLIPPFVAHLPVVDPDLRVNLIVYLTVLVGSAIFCSYFLFVDRRTRLGGATRQARGASAGWRGQSRPA
jgi:hypothetical protein